MLNKEKEYYGFNDVLIKPNYSTIVSRKEVDLRISNDNQTISTKPYMKNWRPIPIMSANMDTVTGPELAFELLKRNWIPVLHKYVSIDEISDLFNKIDQYNSVNSEKIDYRNLFISRGVTEADKEKLLERLQREPRIKSVCIDVANGHTEKVLEYVKDLRFGECSDKILMVGNIGNESLVEKYMFIGVDIIKAGIGPGSACITRVKTGVGIPQISLIDDIVKEVNKTFDYLSKRTINSSIMICSDGGCKTEGDIAKAFAAGAHFVMIGGMLAGYKESPGEIEVIEERTFKRFSGMAAKESQHKGVPNYGTEEGKTVMIPYKGKVIHKLEDIEGGLRSTCTYTNSHCISQLSKAELILTKEQENKVFSK